MIVINFLLSIGTEFFSKRFKLSSEVEGDFFSGWENFRFGWRFLISNKSLLGLFILSVVDFGGNFMDLNFVDIFVGPFVQIMLFEKFMFLWSFVEIARSYGWIFLLTKRRMLRS